MATDSDLDLLSNFSREVRKIQSNVVDKEIHLFQQLFKRIAKIEQFLTQNFVGFADFQPSFGDLFDDEEEAEEPCYRYPTRKKAKRSEVEAVEVEEISPIKREVEEPPDNQNQMITANAINYCEDSDDSLDDNLIGYAISPSLPYRNENGDVNDNDNYGDGETGNETIGTNKGRPKSRLWKFFQTRSDPNGKIILNKCLFCGKHVSPKYHRIQGHIKKCRQIEAKGDKVNKTPAKSKKKKGAGTAKCLSKAPSEQENHQIQMQENNPL